MQALQGSKGRCSQARPRQCESTLLSSASHHCLAAHICIHWTMPHAVTAISYVHGKALYFSCEHRINLMHSFMWLVAYIGDTHSGSQGVQEVLGGEAGCRVPAQQADE